MKINQKQKILFLDNLASLLNSWIPVIQAFDIISFQTKNKKILSIIETIRNAISKWETFFSISMKLSWVFNVFDIAMIETWEATGQIGKAFEVIVSKEEKEFDLKRKVKQALMYPIIILLITFAMLTVIMTFVIPKIEWIYKESNVNLPPLTTAVIGISHFFVNNLLLIIIWIFLVIIVCWILYKKVPLIRLNYDKNILKLPIFWEIIKKKTLINFSDFLSTLLGSWIMINKALQIIKNAMDNSFYSLVVENISNEVKVWKPLSYAMWVNILDKKIEVAQQEKMDLETKTFAFPIELSTAVRIWEQTWTLSKMLHKTSARYTKEIDNTIKNLTTILEPIIIVVIWVIVWTIIMAIMLPFLNIANVVK